LDVIKNIYMAWKIWHIFRISCESKNK
jgi:hypothetical protein